MMASETGLGLGATASSIYSNQGLIGFYKGIDANIMRAIVNNGTKMACYDQSKSLIKNNAPAPLNEGVPLQARACLRGGLLHDVHGRALRHLPHATMNQPWTSRKSTTTSSTDARQDGDAGGPLALWRGFIHVGAYRADDDAAAFLREFTKLAGISAA